jgi:hypothetical protein
MPHPITVLSPDLAGTRYAFRDCHWGSDKRWRVDLSLAVESQDKIPLTGRRIWINHTLWRATFHFCGVVETERWKPWTRRDPRDQDVTWVAGTTHLLPDSLIPINSLPPPSTWTVRIQLRLLPTWRWTRG